ncbi:hypothetical protein niasHT_033220 [Heterodera trifolii]|uniref:Myosin motor domain-containing protein n=1 Tax=Heterodera trifolii TaxID=157864 RepID=A0ABD2J302_9BILA
MIAQSVPNIDHYYEEEEEVMEDEEEYSYEEIDEEEEEEEEEVEKEEKRTVAARALPAAQLAEGGGQNGTAQGNDQLANLADECRRLLEVTEEALEREAKLKMEKGWERRFWVPNSEEGFQLCELRTEEKAEDDEEEEVEVEILAMDSGDERRRRENLKVKVRRECLQKVSASHFCHDLCQLSELNDASVLMALRQRYSLRLVHTYSALFCVVVNPWCPLVPLYSAQMRSLYANANGATLPPHIFAIAQSAFEGVSDGTSRLNQSILITGESGAGKTENTKRIIEYLMDIAESNAKVSECADQQKAATVEKALISAGTALEAFANAQTVHNNNSSRMGKFVRIDFDREGKLHQNAGDRNFHIFYQMFTRSDFLRSEKASRVLCRIWDYRNPYSGDNPRPDGFRFLNQGKAAENVHAKFVDDSEGSRETECALDQLGFSPAEKGWVRELATACVLIGEAQFGERHGMDISFVEEMAEVEAVAELLGIRANALVDALTQPSIRVGDALIRRSQPLRKTLCAAQSLAKCVYERLFSWVLSKCNSAIRRGRKGSDQSDETDRGREANGMVGVLDMAGFEIMPCNSFEQLCINYTNERLQQFFNEFMFIREQEEYLREGISWEFVKDFGRDLQPTIDLIEKPLGILSLLQEECIVPNGSDQSLLDKFVLRLSSASPGATFFKAKQSNRVPSPHHFTIAHYAGPVGYSVDGWLEKNRDAVDGALLELLATSSHSLASQLFARRESAVKGSSPRGSAMAQATISHVYREQLTALLRTLRNTQAHFIRCIVPNQQRQPFVMDGPLVMHQLRCNGVLEGIRICRQGYPNRILFAPFLVRFRILLPSSVPPAVDDPRESVRRLFAAVGVDSAQFQLGRTKVFCRVGLISQLEAMRREKLNESICKLQALIRWAKATKECRKRREQWLSVRVVQCSVRHFVHVRRWLWFRLWLRVRQFLPIVSERRLMAELEAENGKTQMELAEAKSEAEKARKELRENAERTERSEKQWKSDREKAAELSGELRRNEELLEKMERKFDDQHAKIVRLNNNLGEHAKALERTEEEKNAMEKELETLREKFRVERIERESAEESLRLAQQEGVNARVELDEMGAEVRRIRAEMGRKAEELEQSRERTREQQTQLAELNRALSEANDRLGEMQPQIHAEKSARRKAEGLVEELEAEICRITDQLDKANVKRDSMKEQLRVREAQMRKLERNLDDKSAQMEECVQEMRRAHKRTQNEVQEQLEESRRKCNRTERENAQLRSKLETQENEIQLQKSSSRSRLDKVGSNSTLLDNCNNHNREASVDSDFGGGGGVCRSLTARHSLHNASSAHSSAGGSLHRPYRTYRTHTTSSTVLSDPFSAGLRRSASGNSSVHSAAPSLSASSSFFRRHDNGTANPMLTSFATTADSGLLTRSPSSASTISGIQQQQNNAISAQRTDETERRTAALEREMQQQKQDAQMARRELEVYKQMARRELEDSERDRDALGKQLRTLNTEMESLKNELKKEQEQSQRMEFEMRKVRGENGTLKQRVEDEREEKEAEIAMEKKKHAEKVDELTNEFNSRFRQVANAQRSTEQLQTKLAETETQLDRAMGQLAHLERLQKTQNTIGETWEAQYRTAQTELQGIRDENAALKSKIRRQQRQIVLLTQQSEMDSRVNELEEKIGSLGGKTANEKRTEDRESIGNTN